MTVCAGMTVSGDVTLYMAAAMAFRALGSAAISGAAYAEVCAALLFPGPTEVDCHLGVGADGLDGAQFLGEHVD